MAYDYSATLNPKKALIWRIVHRDNLPWILDNGLHCGNSNVKYEHWVSIGNPELTDNRARHPVPFPPHGFLNDYVPFYFTPFSVMMRNIHTGWGLKKWPNQDILILVSSLHHVGSLHLPFMFTDMHAYNRLASFYSELTDLDKIDWVSLQRRDFKRDLDNPIKFERYQAEALIHNHLPVSGLLGIVCYTPAIKELIEQEVRQRGLDLQVHARPKWYF